MTRISIIRGILLLVVPLLMFPLLGSCGDDDETKEPTATITPTKELLPTSTIEPTKEPTSSPEPVEDVVITIGNLTDMTGPASNAFEVINMAVQDLVDYYNENDMILGVEIKVIAYDGQFDPAKDIPGYEWLKEREVDVVFTGVTSAPTTLETRVNQDQIPLFSATAAQEAIDPPGYVFSVGTVPEYDAYTLLRWIAENHWEWETLGPAKIGAASWDDPYARSYTEAMEEYAKKYPAQFEWVGSYLTPFTFSWGPEVDALKECDYIYPPGGGINTFIKEYYEAGYDTHFIGSGVHNAFLGLIDDAGLWDEIDGMLFLTGPKWWTEEGTIIDLTKKLLQDNHPDQVAEIMKAGMAYLGVQLIYQVIDIIADAAETVGAENLDSEAIYEAANTFTAVIDGIQRWSYSPTKRTSVDHYSLHEARASEKNLFRVQEDWLPVVYEP